MIPSVRFYTLAEANAKVSALQSRFEEVEERLARAQDLHDQASDLEIVWGSKLLDPACPGRAEYLKFKAALEAEEAAVNGVLDEIKADGIEVKDAATGLVDFYARRGSDVVYLCWKRGEREVAFWHTLQGGFAGRKPIKEF